MSRVQGERFEETFVIKPSDADILLQKALTSEVDTRLNPNGTHDYIPAALALLPDHLKDRLKKFTAMTETINEIFIGIVHARVRLALNELRKSIGLGENIIDGFDKLNSDIQEAARSLTTKQFREYQKQVAKFLGLREQITDCHSEIKKRKAELTFFCLRPTTAHLAVTAEWLNLRLHICDEIIVQLTAETYRKKNAGENAKKIQRLIDDIKKQKEEMQKALHAMTKGMIGQLAVVFDKDDVVRRNAPILPAKSDEQPIEVDLLSNAPEYRLFTPLSQSYPSKLSAMTAVLQYRGRENGLQIFMRRIAENGTADDVISLNEKLKKLPIPIAFDPVAKIFSPLLPEGNPALNYVHPRQESKWLSPSTWESGPFTNWHNYRRDFLAEFSPALMELNFAAMNLNSLSAEIVSKSPVGLATDPTWMDCLESAEKIGIKYRELRAICEKWMPSMTAFSAGARHTKALIKAYEEQLASVANQLEENRETVAGEIKKKMFGDLTDANPELPRLTDSQRDYLLNKMHRLDPLAAVALDSEIATYFATQIHGRSNDYFSTNALTQAWVEKDALQKLCLSCQSYASSIKTKEAIGFIAKLLQGEISASEFPAQYESAYQKWLSGKSADECFGYHHRNNPYYQLAKAAEVLVPSSEADKKASQVFITDKLDAVLNRASHDLRVAWCCKTGSPKTPATHKPSGSITSIKNLFVDIFEKKTAYVEPNDQFKLDAGAFNIQIGTTKPKPADLTPCLQFLAREDLTGVHIAEIFTAAEQWVKEYDGNGNFLNHGDEVRASDILISLVTFCNGKKIAGLGAERTERLLITYAEKRMKKLFAYSAAESPASEESFTASDKSIVTRIAKRAPGASGELVKSAIQQALLNTMPPDLAASRNPIKRLQPMTFFIGVAGSLENKIDYIRLIAKFFIFKLEKDEVRSEDASGFFFRLLKNLLISTSEADNEDIKKSLILFAEEYRGKNNSPSVESFLDDLAIKMGADEEILVAIAVRKTIQELSGSEQVESGDIFEIASDALALEPDVDQAARLDIYWNQLLNKLLNTKERTLYEKLLTYVNSRGSEEQKKRVFEHELESFLTQIDEIALSTVQDMKGRFDSCVLKMMEKFPSYREGNAADKFSSKWLVECLGSRADSLSPLQLLVLYDIYQKTNPTEDELKTVRQNVLKGMLQESTTAYPELKVLFDSIDEPAEAAAAATAVSSSQKRNFFGFESNTSRSNNTSFQSADAVADELQLNLPGNTNPYKPWSPERQFVAKELGCNQELQQLFWLFVVLKTPAAVGKKENIVGVLSQLNTVWLKDFCENKLKNAAHTTESFKNTFLGDKQFQLLIEALNEFFDKKYYQNAAPYPARELTACFLVIHSKCVELNFSKTEAPYKAFFEHGNALKAFALIDDAVRALSHAVNLLSRDSLQAVVSAFDTLKNTYQQASDANEQHYIAAYPLLLKQMKSVCASFNFNSWKHDAEYRENANALVRQMVQRLGEIPMKDDFLSRMLQRLSQRGASIADLHESLDAKLEALVNASETDLITAYLTIEPLDLGLLAMVLSDDDRRELTDKISMVLRRLQPSSLYNALLSMRGMLSSNEFNEGCAKGYQSYYKDNIGVAKGDIKAALENGRSSPNFNHLHALLKLKDAMSDDEKNEFRTFVLRRLTFAEIAKLSGEEISELKDICVGMRDAAVHRKLNDLTEAALASLTTASADDSLSFFKEKLPLLKTHYLILKAFSNNSSDVLRILTEFKETAYPKMLHYVVFGGDVAALNTHLIAFFLSESGVSMKENVFLAPATELLTRCQIAYASVKSSTKNEVEKIAWSAAVKETPRESSMALTKQLYIAQLMIAGEFEVAAVEFNALRLASIAFDDRIFKKSIVAIAHNSEILVKACSDAARPFFTALTQPMPSLEGNIQAMNDSHQEGMQQIAERMKAARTVLRDVCRKISDYEPFQFRRESGELLPLTAVAPALDEKINQTKDKSVKSKLEALRVFVNQCFPDLERSMTTRIDTSRGDLTVLKTIYDELDGALDALSKAEELGVFGNAGKLRTCVIGAKTILARGKASLDLSNDDFGKSLLSPPRSPTGRTAHGFFATGAAAAASASVTPGQLVGGKPWTS